jgi:cold shock protein
MDSALIQQPSPLASLLALRYGVKDVLLEGNADRCGHGADTNSRAFPCIRRPQSPYAKSRCGPCAAAPSPFGWMLAIAGEPFPDTESSGLSVGPLTTGSSRTTGKGIRMRIAGTVKFFNSAKGFGFITPEDGSKDVFVHATAVEQAGLRTLNEGDRVTFTLEDDRKGRGKQAAQLEKA